MAITNQRTNVTWVNFRKRIKMHRREQITQGVLLWLAPNIGRYSQNWTKLAGANADVCKLDDEHSVPGGPAHSMLTCMRFYTLIIKPYVNSIILTMNIVWPKPDHKPFPISTIFANIMVSIRGREQAAVSFNKGKRRYFIPCPQPTQHFTVRSIPAIVSFVINRWLTKGRQQFRI